jgi:cation:H+ antiporter
VWLVIIFGFAFSVPAGMAGEALSYNLLLFVASLLLLVKAAGWLVDGSSNIAKHFGIPTIIIGITVVAFGTSLPELTVSALANLAGSSGISIGNVVGSNISNICLVLGIAAILVPIKINKKLFSFDIPFLLVASLILPVLSLKMFFDFSSGEYVIGFVDGLIMLALFVFFLYRQVREARKSTEKHRRHQESRKIRRNKLLGYLIVLMAGLTFVILSAGFLVESGRGLARIFGVPEVIIGLTMVAVGTSLPELATNVVAALKKKLDLAVGNIIGSNVFNILLVLGTSAVIKPIRILEQSVVLYDMPIMIGITLLLVVLMRSGSDINRKNGIALFAIYILYVTYLFTRIA